MKGALRGAFRSVLLGWTDPQSGDRFTVRLRGEDGLLESLAPLGFELLGGEDGAARAEPEIAPGPWTARVHRAPSARGPLTPGIERTGGSAAAG